MFQTRISRVAPHWDLRRKDYLLIELPCHGKLDKLEQLRVLFEVALEDVLDVPEDVAHVEDVLGAGQVDEQVALGGVLTLELLADELRRKLI